MDWTTIRVLTDNLGELLDQFERGEHIEPPSASNYHTESVKDSWRVGIIGLTVSLAQALNVGTQDFENVNSDMRRFSWLRSLDGNFYTRQAVALFGLGRKLLADMESATGTARAADPAAAASP